MKESEFPFLDRIPVDLRLDAIEQLHRYQQKHHPHVGLDITRAIQRGTWPPKMPAVVLSDAPSYEYEHEKEIEREMQQPPHSPEFVN